MSNKLLLTPIRECAMTIFFGSDNGDIGVLHSIILKKISLCNTPPDEIYKATWDEEENQKILRNQIRALGHCSEISDKSLKPPYISSLSLFLFISFIFILLHNEWVGSVKAFNCLTSSRHIIFKIVAIILCYIVFW